MPVYQVTLAELPKRCADLSSTGSIGCSMDDVRYAVKWLTDQGMPEPNVYVADVSCPDAAAEEIGGRTMQIYAGAGKISRAGICNTVAHEYGHSTEKEAFTAEDLHAFKQIFASNTNGVLPNPVLLAIRGWSELIAEAFAYLYGPPEVWEIPFKFKFWVGDWGFGPNASKGFEDKHKALAAIYRRAWQRRGYMMPFTDLKDNWNNPTIVWATEVGLVKGYPDGTFKPDQPVTRAEFVEGLKRLYELLSKHGANLPT